MSNRTYQNSKEDIIDSAIRVLSKERLRGFTTEAVIRESGLSKAGFFYNFKTKKDLLSAVVQKLGADWGEELSTIASKDKNPVGRKLRANLRSSFKHFSEKDPSKVALYSALTEMVLTQPKIFKELTNDDSWPQPSLEEGISIEQQLIVYLVLDGMLSQLILPTLKITEKQREKVFEILLRMTEVPIKFETKGSGK